MKGRHSVLLDTARNVRTFLDEHAAIIGPTITSARHSLDDAAKQLLALAVTQSDSIVAGRGAAARQKALRTTLRKSLAGRQLIAFAYGMADAAEKYGDVFTQNGLPTEFVPARCTAADAVTEADTDRQVALATGSGEVAAMTVQATRVRGLLRVVNALVVPRLGTDATLPSRWKVARTIDGRKAITGVPTSVSAAVAPAMSSPPSAAPRAAATPSQGGLRKARDSSRGPAKA